MNYFKLSVEARMKQSTLDKIQCKKDFNFALPIVSNYFNIKESDIVGECRKRAFVEPRHALWFALREVGNKLTHIGSLTSNKDHTTVLNGYRKIFNIKELDWAGRSTEDDKKIINFVTGLIEEIWLAHYEPKAA